MSKSVVITGATVSNVHEVESTQEDNTRIFHTIFSGNKDEAECVIVHANDVDVTTSPSIIMHQY